jgi:hypothetical protein
MSDHNRIDHNRFEGKRLAGCFVVIDGSGKPDPRSSQYDRIDHNHFRDSGPRIENGKEAVRLGWSGMSRTSGFTTVEHNLFEDCDGDPEIVSVKTCDDTVRHNTVRRSQGSVTLRAGNRSTVEGNFFLGGGKAGTGGVRIHGDDHRVFNNYFEGLTGTGCSAPLSIPAGDADPDTSLDYRLHFPARRARVAFNTLVANARAIEIGTGCVAGAYPPADLVLEGNLVTGDGAGLERTVAAAGGALWRDNLMWPTGAGAVAIAATPGIVIADPRLVRAGELWRIGPAGPAIDAAEELAWVPTDMDGQRRDRPDIGADEYATGPALVYPLGRGDVGPDAFEVRPAVVTGRMPAIAVDPVVHANAPNPFSVATRIDFTLPVGGPVELAVYDVEGRRVALLADGPLDAGRQSVEWRPSGIPPGIYHLRLRVGASIATRTMLYLR